MSGGTIRYNFANLGTLAGQFFQSPELILQVTGQLKRQVNMLAANWESGGAADYQLAQADWDRIFTDARLRLNGLGAGVAKASSRMHETDVRVGKSFAT